MTGRMTFSIVALALWLTLAATASATSYDPIASGTTTITLARSLTTLLAKHHVSIEVRAGAKRKGQKVVLPATGGEFEPVHGFGTVETEGTLVFVSGKRKVPFRAIVFKAKRSPLYARVGGTQFKVASAKQLKSKREGFGIGFTATGLRLSAKVVSRLNKKLRLGKAIVAGQEFGTITAKVAPRTVHLLPQDRISLAIDPAFAAKLDQLFVSLNPIAPAELGPGPTLSFPIGLESVLAPDASAGLVKTNGAVELLQLGSAQIFWREVLLEPESGFLSSEVDIEPSPPRPGRQPLGPLLSLPAGGQLTSNPSQRTIALSGRAAFLTATTAEALDSSFAEGKPVFAAGERVGALSFAAAAE